MYNPDKFEIGDYLVVRGLGWTVEEVFEDGEACFASDKHGEEKEFHIDSGEIDHHDRF